MKSMLKAFAAAGALALTVSSAAFAQDEAVTQETETEYKFEKAAAYYGQCANTDNADFERIRSDVAAFTDMEIMAETLNSPVKFFRLMNVMNDPRTIHVMANCATEPVMWDTWMENGFDMEKWTAASAKLMNPEGMFKWMMAPLDGEVWTEIAAHAEYDKYERWVVAFINPDFYSPLTSMFDLEWYEPRLAWFADADSYDPMLEMFAPFLVN